MANTQANLVASFDAGIFTVSAQPVGVCIKFKLMNGEETLTHWPLMHFSKLIRIFEEYINHGRHQNFMFTVKQNSQLEEAFRVYPNYRFILLWLLSISDQSSSKYHHH